VEALQGLGLQAGFAVRRERRFAVCESLETPFSKVDPTGNESLGLLRPFREMPGL